MLTNYFGSYGTTKNEALGALDPVVDKVLDALQYGTYEAYIALLTEEFSTKIESSLFRKAHRSISSIMGNLESRSFLCAIKRQNNPVLVYAARYSESDDTILISVTFKNKTYPLK